MRFEGVPEGPVFQLYRPSETAVKRFNHNNPSLHRHVPFAIKAAMLNLYGGVGYRVKPIDRGPIEARVWGWDTRFYHVEIELSGKRSSRMTFRAWPRLDLQNVDYSRIAPSVQKALALTNNKAPTAP